MGGSSGGERTSNTSSGSSSASSKGNSHWPDNRLPLTITYSDDFSNSDHSYFSSMLGKWETATNGGKDFFTSTTTGPNVERQNLEDYYDGEMGIYRLTDWPSSLSSDALAVTQYFGVTRIDSSGRSYIELEHADIFINEENWNFSTNGSNGTYDLPSIILHETGHLLGLDHSSSNTVMGPTISAGTIQRSLTATDEYNIQNNYGLTGSSSFSSMAISGTMDAQLLGTELAHPNEGSEDTGSYDGKLVRGFILLSASGECQHYLL